MTEDGTASKGEFARMCNVTPGRLSQWLAEGKITGDAIVGEGRMARIDIAKARAQLNIKLDMSQRLGNGIDTDLGDRGDRADRAPASAREPGVEDQIKAARLAQMEAANRRTAEEDRLRRGIYMLTEDAQQEMARIAGTMITIIEGSLTDLATALAARFEIPQRDALHELRTRFREIRANAAERLGAELAVMEPFSGEGADHDLSGEPEAGQPAGNRAGDPAAGPG